MIRLLRKVKLFLGGSSGFNPLTGLSFEVVLDADSVAASQNPTGLGPSNAHQVEFGPAQKSGSDPVMISALGLLTINQTGLYRIFLTVLVGRAGSPGTSQVLVRILIDGTQVGSSVTFRVNNADDTTPARTARGRARPRARKTCLS